MDMYRKGKQCVGVRVGRRSSVWTRAFGCGESAAP